MLSPKEAHELFMQRSSPEVRKRMSRLIERGKLMLEGWEHEKPDAIIGGGWPSKQKGARRGVCVDCMRYVALSPNSGAPMADKFPDVPVLCFGCAEKRALGRT